ncbi:hypothetical protein AQUCO_02100144v1 [Aquilegia coerulea]|uniref:Uncharacterized protein n=1 Tax=Aquilegia coerulea TaxID=218851 RepID=A0A2G5DEW7_AQUCA|nr:hypothetical protein AQUCO_02100144v1 [Aquilegia coerulea]
MGVCPHARTWEHKTFPYHEAMATLCGDEVATGDYDNGGEEPLDIPDDEGFVETDDLGVGVSQAASLNGFGEAPGFTDAPAGSTGASASTDIPLRHEIPVQANSQLPSKRKKSRFSHESDYNKGMIDVIQNLADSLVATAPTIVAPQSYMDQIKVALVVGDDRDLYADSLEFLALNTTLGEVFLRLDEDMRLGWLRRKLTLA